MTAHAYAIVDAFIYGFALQEAAQSLPHGGEEEIGELAEQIIAALPAEAYPHFTELTTHHVLQPGYGFGKSFDVGLDHPRRHRGGRRASVRPGEWRRGM